jgi:hypothetical protein
MASELRVNTLKDASGNNSVAMSTVAGGSAKAWIVYDQANTNVDNSLNSSSVTDNSTADFTRNHTSSFSNVSYTNTGGGSYNLNDAAGTDALGHRHKVPTTSSVRMVTNYGQSGTPLDWQLNDIESNGDLA